MEQSLLIMIFVLIVMFLELKKTANLICELVNEKSKIIAY